jgi:D-ribose pyranase
MKKSGLLNEQLSGIIAATGHTDLIVVSDAGLPVPLEVEKVDLALLPNQPRFLDVLKAVAAELSVEALILAEETETLSPELYRDILALFPDLPVEKVRHEEFKRRTRGARALVRSGEFTAYANVILVAGCVYGASAARAR